MKKTSSAVVPVIAVNRKADRPLHNQIYDAYRALIVNGNLRPGQQLPSTRALTSELKVSRIPVLTAYAQLLAEGYCETRVGAGTFVSRSLPEQMLPTKGSTGIRTTMRPGSRSIARRAQVLPRYQTQPGLRGLGPFCVGQPAYHHYPFNIWANLVGRHCRNPRPGELHYGGPFGFEGLRDAICNYLRTARSVRCTADQVLIVSGSQQALEISARVLLDPGDWAWVEEPGYWLTRQVVTAAGGRLAPIPVDNEGLNVATGIKRCPKARAAYITPSHQYPLGATMSASRRFQLLEWADRAGSWIVEDDYDSEYRYGSMPIAALQGIDRGARVIYTGTFSKTMFPALRLGYVVVPPDLVDRFAAVRNAMDLGPPYFLQAVLADFINEGHFARHIRRMRLLYNERRIALVDSLQKEFGTGHNVLGAEAGMHLVVTFPKGFRDVDVAERAAREKLWLVSLSSSYVGSRAVQGFILGFGGAPVAEIPRAVRQLKLLLMKAMVATGTSRTQVWLT
jgi:GntR family transcriptional regulator/MocR family aminotransferase